MTQDPRMVLLVEDTLDDEQLALRALRGCGVPVVVQVARDGAQALDKLGLAEPGDGEGWVPDLVISDFKMPKVNGDELLRRTRADRRLRDVPYVVFSSSEEPKDVERCMSLGASQYATKPVDYAEYMDLARSIARRWLRDAA